MSGKSWIGVWVLLGLLPIWAEASPDKLNTDQAGQAITLSAPARGTVVGYGDLLCAWRHRQDPVEEGAVAWELGFVPQKGGQAQTLRLESGDVLALASGLYSYRIAEIRRLLRQPGRYQWRVTAVYADGRRISSQFSSVVIGVKDLGVRFEESATRFEVRMGSIRRAGNGDFKQLLTGMANPDPMRRHANLNFVFHQEGGRWHLKESVLLHSSVGMGGGLGLDFRLCQNGYFGLRPGASFTAAWSSAGLRDYSGLTATWRVGCDLVIQPQGYVTLKAAYLPSLRVRYATTDGELRTFRGKGWEVGARVVFSNELLKPFTLLGARVDLSRMPIEIHVGEVKDDYTGTRMKQTRLSIGYIL